MKIFQIINPKAGHGDAVNAELKKTNAIKYTTKCVGDARRYVNETCLNNPEDELRFIVCGGDGTIHEVINGIMDANAGNRAAFSIMPTGSGNDFMRAFNGKKGVHKIDLIKYNGKYAANMINIGFDCNVADKTALYKNKKMISGSSAYILGLVNVLSHKMGQNFKITVIDDEDMEHVFEDECLLTAIGNLPYCGGGFKALPLAVADDGLLDMLIVNKISRAKFVSLVSDYRKGSFIDADTMEVKDKFKKVLKYYKCKKVIVENTVNLCADGEIEATERVEISVAANALSYIN
ncbi:MAG: hypothetical protein IKU52_00695 [Clostridia bacterium]|nr:hypothetical protein [Clostridia bacterium]